VPPAAAGQASVDAPIRIPRGQVTTQPSLIAAMVAALGLTGTERVLEVGTGLGFQAAILAMLARRVVSVERFADLAAQARANLAAAGLGRVTVVVGDGTLGVPEHAPDQAIIVAAASPRVPAPLIQQRAWGAGWSIRSVQAAASRSPPSTRKPAGSSPTPSSPRPGSSPWSASMVCPTGSRASRTARG
jgi:protein-L-isoaspartate(D-aspartate) O-methyltransferase